MADNPNAGARSRLDRLIDALAVLAGALLCALVAIVCLDVAARSLHLFATPWTLDLTEYGLYLITFFGAPWVLRERGHIAIEIVVERLPGPARRAFERLANVLGALVCAILFLVACVALARSYASGALVYQTFVFPEWYLFVFAPPVFLLLLAIYVRWIVRPGDAQPGQGG
ncbi:MAG: TRAP transporter small permease [Betaproteobacteria bacterium]|nr:TRAP transporter small permease [Betaproteobacteria bacterium]